MRLPFVFFLGVFGAIGLTAGSATAQAKPDPDPDPRPVIRERVRDVIDTNTLKEFVRVRMYQGRDRGPEQTERFSAKYRIGRDGRVSINNIAGDIVVTVGGGDEVTVDAVKRTRGDRGQLEAVRIEADNAAGRVDIRTAYPQMRNVNVSVDFNLTVPAAASVDLHSISGALKVTGIRGGVRAETISGAVTATDTPKLELAKSVSGNVTLTDVRTEGDVSAGTISGTMTAKSVKAHGLDFSSISGDLMISDTVCDRLGAKSVSGSVEYVGGINRTARYSLTSHSGSIRLTLANPAGFELNADSFSGTIRSDFAVTIGGTSGRDDRRRIGPGRSMHAVFGDGGATLTIRTFSGTIRSDFAVTLGGTSARDDRRRMGPGRSTHAVFGDGGATLTIRTFSGDIVIAKR
ncbi:MAG TPA: DUF4097 family beta strand repeat-containing protein [Vicinamibacterales bacterium]|nr:DUF4097 family beta strand repeat-containing protein [Vicinamibacterales bacterium]